MSAIKIFKRITARFPNACSQITELPSGAIRLHITINKVPYSAEYLPYFSEYGLSNIAVATPFREGFDQSFTSAEQLEQKIVELMGVNHE